MKIAIVGSRDYPDLEEVRIYVRTLPKDTIVVSGGARGVDSVAVAEAKTLGLETKVFPAEWDKYGNSAGMFRNQTIVAYADEVVAFWDGQSKGTLNTRNRAKSTGKPLTTFQRSKDDPTS